MFPRSTSTRIGPRAREQRLERRKIAYADRLAPDLDPPHDIFDLERAVESGRIPHDDAVRQDPTRRLSPDAGLERLEDPGRQHPQHRREHDQRE